MKGSPRILQVANQAGPLYLFMLPLSRALEQTGAKVEYACMPVGALWEPFRQSGADVHVLPKGSWRNPLTWWKLYWKLRALLRARYFDLMIVHTPVMSWIARLAADGLVPASIYFSHGLPFAPEQPRSAYLFFQCIERLMARYTNAVIVMNSTDAAVCQRLKLTRSEGNWYYVPGVGVDVDAYASRPAKHLMMKLEQEFGLRAGKQMVLFLGRFIRSKRPGDVLELARRMGDEVDYVMAGEGPLWHRIKAEASTIGPHIKVVEFTDRIAELLSRCSLLVLPSVFREGLPRVLLEAQAAGKPAVAYNVRGACDVIEHGKTGFLARPGNTDELYEAVSNILKDNELANGMGKMGQKRVREKFSIDASVSASMAAISKVLQQKKICNLQMNQSCQK
jgi:glycosyltransferase involved in cell wall biosynthesis